MKYTSSEPSEPSPLKYGMKDPGTRIPAERIAAFIDRVFNSPETRPAAAPLTGEAAA